MIIICEPQCIGFEHAEFNASLIKIVQHAYPNKKILFLSESEHLRYVKNILETNNEKIKFMEIKIPPRRFNLKRFPSEFKIVKNVFNLSTTIKADRILFSSITSPILISIKILIQRFKGIRIMLIPHSLLELINSRIPLLPIETIFWLNFWISFFNTPNLTYLILGPSIKESLIQKMPHLKKYLISIDLPCLFKNQEIKKYKKNDILKFGFLGVGKKSKGIDIFIKLAHDVQKQNEKPKFIVIGHIIEGSYEKSYVCIPSPKLPLKQEKYNEYIQEIDYAIFLYKKDSYKLTASGALFDAFSHLKPVIVLRNPFFEYYFDKMGDIGYLCDDYEELRDLIINIINNPPNERYINQQKNILNGRNQFRQDKLAKTLRDEWV